MEKREFKRLVRDIFEVTRQQAPEDTGNLSENALKLVWIDQNTARIYIDEEIAPYMPYTNEPWVSSWWRGKQNPNLYWFDKMAQIAKMMIESATGAEASRSSYNFADVDLLKMEREYQNKTGDYSAYDAYYHSSYLSETHMPLSQWIGAVGGKYGG
jgi:hypothetical protein